MQILSENQEEKKELKLAFIARKNDLSPKHIIIDDIIASVSYLLNLPYGIGRIDDIDHLWKQKTKNCW